MPLWSAASAKQHEFGLLANLSTTKPAPSFEDLCSCLSHTIGRSAGAARLKRFDNYFASRYTLWCRREDGSEAGERGFRWRSGMDSEQSTSDAAVPKDLKSQTNISTGIGPTGTDTPAPKDTMPHADHLEHSLEEPLSRPTGALFQVGSGLKKEMSEKIPESINELPGEEQPGSNGAVTEK